MCVSKILSFRQQKGLFNVSLSKPNSRFVYFFAELNLLVSVWLGADGRANQRLTAPTGFRLSSLSTATHYCHDLSKRLHFCEIALVAFEPGSLRPRTRQATVPAPPVLESTFAPVPVAVESRLVQAQPRLRTRSV
ncbi:hypothetical protein PoB_004750000 [Plakobranchus ocellatus]|uniref:Uncharacterized protein n=1 Tax=Plakobranchus ocellatus TaxID=259542 RepID=A0AAV4BKE8_9GAST|nr:hypothetical protein PoB_004750000 [Plakobranchus ocellatus]